ncbi:hypothetical protein [Lacinutrix venerupis]|uniref:Uncharacterized protein n=1 Tax=Lacinutrix venerupis TaxID=1486034 RepID=A0AAC9LL36_9FLAO|nr:hypothetical protein [Lacinutrix venerupis]APY00439.1 hypothetical protein BWR22_08940 [Lacinutrix venerupis]
MKKIGIGIIVLVAIFISLLYWSLSSTEKTFKKGELLNINNIETINFKNIDSVLISASTLYKANNIKTLMQGEQYRKAWEAPIKVPIVFLDSLKGGLKILKEGGGKQTHSIKLLSKNGTKYTLRGINKDPKKLIPEFAKTFGLENIIVDGISAQHPYGSILSAALAKRAKILSTEPQVVFVPKQEALGTFNLKYGNRLYLLEYETEGETNWTNYKNVSEIVETDNLQELKLKSQNSIVIDKSVLIRVRLFDFLIGDWDRHAKQYGWILQKNNNNYTAIPLAGDRDNAFFKSEGLIPSILSNKYVIPELQDFEKEIDFLPGLVYPFDRYFLFNTNEDIFITEAKKLQELLTDDVLNKALNVWPKNIRALDGQDIISTIKARRTDLVDYAKAFKKIIDEKGLLTEALKGSEDLALPKELLQCFDCN